MITPKSTTIVIVSYKTGSVLFDCLSACLNLPEKPQIVLVDNGNPLSDLDKLGRWADANPQITLITGHGNIGFAAGVNKGVAASHTDYIWILNPDAVPAPDTLTRHYQSIVDVDVPFLIGAAIRHSDGSEQRGGRREVLTPRLAFIETFGLYRFARLHPFFARYNHHEDAPEGRLVRMPVVSGASMFMRREDFIRLNGFDEKYFMHVEDMDLCLRMGRMGGHVYYAGHIPLTHIGGTSDADKSFVEWHKAKGFVYYFHKNFGEQHSRLLLNLVAGGIYARYALMNFKMGWQKLGRRKPHEAAPAAIDRIAETLPVRHVFDEAVPAARKSHLNGG